MAAEITRITDGNQDEVIRYLDHILTDLHDALQRLRDLGMVQDRHDLLLREFEPLLAQFRAPGPGLLAMRRARRGDR